MKKIVQLTALAMALLLSGHAYAQIIWASGTANNEISLGASNDAAYLDWDGNGTNDSAGVIFDQQRDIIGAPDAMGIVRHTAVESFVFALYNPLTGALLNKSGLATHVDRFDEPTTPGFFTQQDFGNGIFTVGANRYVVDMVGVDNSGAVPGLIGTPYIDASLSVVIINIVTGTVVKRFTIHSNSTYQLLPGECRFADINGTTRFIERYMKRDAAVPGPPPFTSNNPLLIKVWDATHTTLIKKFIQRNTTRVIP